MRGQVFDADQQVISRLLSEVQERLESARTDFEKKLYTRIKELLEEYIPL